ncbi:sugar isomerase [candidate division KSB1 bacterium]
MKMSAGAGSIPFLLSSTEATQDSGEFNVEFQKIGTSLKVKPCLLYHLHKRKEAATWREWGGLKTQGDVEKEVNNINRELKDLVLRADFPIKMLPLTQVNSDNHAKAVADCDCDVILLYGAGSAGDRVYKQNRLDIIANSGKSVIMFLRHKSGPIYLWYEIAHPKLLRSATDEYLHKYMNIDDIVVDEYNHVIWRLRSLFGLKNIKGTKLVAINGMGGWGEGGEHAPRVAKEVWNLDVETVGIKEVAERMDKKLSDQAMVEEISTEVHQYLNQKNIVSVNTKEEFIMRAFILKDIFKDLMKESDAVGVTVRGCMGIGGDVGTTPCLSLSLINDEGLMAFCESDFVVIPSGVLLRYISGKPVFLNDPCYPYDGKTTCAHCSAPTRMDGKRFEPTHIYTHCESDYGAAPKVEFKKGQIVTNIIPDFNSKKWIGFKGQITDHPFYDICRSQFDCTIEGDWKKLLKDMRGFHWMTAYGDYLKEMEYAVRKAGIEWERV